MLSAALIVPALECSLHLLLILCYGICNSNSFFLRSDLWLLLSALYGFSDEAVLSVVASSKSLNISGTVSLVI